MDKIDTYIEKNYDNDYTMYFHYNGVEFVFLYKDPDARGFAIHYSHKVKKGLPGIVYTDDRGWVKEYDDDSIISSINGLDNIKNSILDIAMGCKNLDIQANLSVHLNEKEFNVTCVDENASYYDSKIKLDTDVMINLDNEIDALKINDESIKQV